MKDAIDVRNEKERYARSIVKRRNIMYMTREQAQMHKNLEEAQVVIEQLLNENDKKSAALIKQLLAEQQMLQVQLNTGMDATGTVPMSQENHDRIEAILNEKNRLLQDLIATHSVEANKEDKAVDQAVPQDLLPDGGGAEGMAEACGMADGEGSPQEDGLDLPNMDAVLQEIG